jgi:mono/diheme cytochrome c family protein
VSGGEFWSEPGYARLVAPDLTRVAASHSDAELERVIRHGVRRDGRSTFGMPSSMFHHLSDADLGRIIAFLRSLPVGDGPDTETHFGPFGRLDLLLHPEYAYAEEIARDAPWLTETDLRGEHGQGEYLAMTVCSECHAMDLGGSPDGSTPDLVVVGAYSQADFARLMKTGIAVGDRQLGLMTAVAKTRFSQLHDLEVQALYDFLTARAREPQTYE